MIARSRSVSEFFNLPGGDTRSQFCGDFLRRRLKNKSVFETVGERTRALRKAAGLSQEQLAERAELHYTYVGAVERAERNVTLDMLVRIADGLGVAVGDFFLAPNATSYN